MGPIATCCATASSRISSPAAADILFLDPPYGGGMAAPALASAKAMGWLKPDALVVVQQHPKEPFAAPAGFHLVDDRRYGANHLYFLERGEGGGGNG